MTGDKKKTLPVLCSLKCIGYFLSSPAFYTVVGALRKMNSGHYFSCVLAKYGNMQASAFICPQNGQTHVKNFPVSSWSYQKVKLFFTSGWACLPSVICAENLSLRNHWDSRNQE